MSVLKVKRGTKPFDHRRMKRRSNSELLMINGFFVVYLKYNTTTGIILDISYLS